MSDTGAERHDTWHELDVVQHQIVSTVAARQENRDKVCFKGGTMLRSCWKRDYRYSEDLDFDWLDGGEADKGTIYTFFDNALKQAHRRFGTKYELNWGANTLNIAWQTRNGSGLLRMDVKHRDHSKVLPTRKYWTLIDRHPRIPFDVPILGYALESVLAAKLSCAITGSRVAPRDYYDLDRLLADPEIDKDAAVEEFRSRLAIESPSTSESEDWLSPIFDAVYLKMPRLEERWSAVVDAGMIPQSSGSLEQVVARVFDMLVEVSQSQSGDDEEPTIPPNPLIWQDGPPALAANWEMALTQSKAVCGAWMPIAEACCMLTKGHGGGHRSR